MSENIKYIKEYSNLYEAIDVIGESPFVATIKNGKEVMYASKHNFENGFKIVKDGDFIKPIHLYQYKLVASSNNEYAATIIINGSPDYDNIYASFFDGEINGDSFKRNSVYDIEYSYNGKMLDTDFSMIGDEDEIEQIKGQYYKNRLPKYLKRNVNYDRTINGTKYFAYTYNENDIIYVLSISNSNRQNGYFIDGDDNIYELDYLIEIFDGKDILKCFDIVKNNIELTRIWITQPMLIEDHTMSHAYTFTENNIAKYIGQVSGDFINDIPNILLTVTGEKQEFIINTKIKSICISPLTNLSLTYIEIPDGVEEIGDESFRDCNNLKEVVLPDSIKKIGNSAFSNCDIRDSITIPKNVTSIGYDAFANNYNLEWVYFLPETPPSIEMHSFYYGSGNSINMCVPRESVNEYITELEKNSRHIYLYTFDSIPSSESAEFVQELNNSSGTTTQQEI